MKKHTSISELEQGDSRQPIWAINGSADSEVGQPGNVHVGIPKLHGTKIDELFLPQSWLPVCLTDQIPRAQLLSASEFRNAVNNKLLILITPEFAAQVKAQEGANEEEERLKEMKRVVREATQARTISGSGAEIISTVELDQPKEVKASTDLAPAFTMFANSLSVKTDIEAMNLIRGRGKSSVRELKYLVANLKDKPKTLKFMTSLLAAKKPRVAA